jgi:hypothetical protein
MWKTACSQQALACFPHLDGTIRPQNVNTTSPTLLKVVNHYVHYLAIFEVDDMGDAVAPVYQLSSAHLFPPLKKH